MPEPISRSEAIATLLRLGYEVLVEEGDFVILFDPNYPMRPLAFNFSQGEIDWDDVRKLLEYEGVDVARFLAELESA